MAVSTLARGAKQGFILAWKKETNWGAVWQWLPLALIRPLGGALLIWVMTRAAGDRGAAFLAPAFVGNALFILVPAILGGAAIAAIEDRERYQMLKYIYLTPGGIAPCLLGHGLARALHGAIGASTLLAAGLLLLDIRIPSFNPALFAAVAACFALTLTFGGLAIAGICLHTARHGHFAAESIGGALFLFSGAVFPLDVLPSIIRPVAFASPVAWAMEGFRRSLGLSFGRSFDSVTTPALLAALAAFSAAAAVAGLAGFARAERKARWKGLLDATTAS
jgi:ABC-2 type transport system permease protein